MSIVVWPEQTEEWYRAIRAAAGDNEVVVPASQAEAKTAAAAAEFWVGQLDPELLAAAPRLRALQWTSVSLERVLFPELARSPVQLMNMRHIWDDHISNHVLALFYALSRDLPRLSHRQIERKWTSRAEFAGRVRDPASMTVLIVGLGGIGAETARRLSVSGPTILGIDPYVAIPPEGVRAVATPDRLAEFLPQADAVIICAPQTPDTVGLFDENMLRRMRSDAFLINIGRGKIVKLEALERAITEGWIAGAGFDVFEIEPLPESSPLWTAENVIITPHVAGTGNPRSESRRIAIVVDNVRRFVSGEPFVNVIDKERWQ